MHLVVKKCHFGCEISFYWVKLELYLEIGGCMVGGVLIWEFLGICILRVWGCGLGCVGV